VAGGGRGGRADEHPADPADDVALSEAATRRPRVALRRPDAADEAAFLALAEASRALHDPWVRAPRTPVEFRYYLTRAAGEWSVPPAHVCRLVVRPDDAALLGVCNLNNLVWGGLRAASLGYYAFAPAAGHGYVREGVAQLLTLAFRRVGLHRVEAAVQPENAASRALVRALGFRHEGTSPRYLKLGGRWRDHERWAIHAEEWRPGRTRAPRRLPVRRAE
jgi:ribosomal-protein-alanine N-acetyltransferase